MGPLREAGRLGPAAMATIFIAGLWMMALRWGAQAWIIAALVGLVVMAVLGAVLTRAALGRLRISLAGESTRLQADSSCARGGTAPHLALASPRDRGRDLGSVTGKPDAFRSAVIMGAAVAVGVGAAARRPRADVPATSAPGIDSNLRSSASDRGSVTDA